MTLVLPKHVAQQRMKEREKERNEAAQRAIAATTVHSMASDDFCTPQSVIDQLRALQDYVDARRKVEPEYDLPEASGWRLLVLMLTIPETTKGGLVIIDETKEQRAMMSPQGVILSMGKGAYTDPDRFSIKGWFLRKIHPWHAVGDRITFVKYDAHTFQLANGQRLGVLNDTQPLTTLDRGWRVPQ
jgi:co-chaperonin GroES (HSP10)